MTFLRKMKEIAAETLHHVERGSHKEEALEKQRTKDAQGG